MKVVIFIIVCVAIANAALVSPIVPLKDLKGHESRIISGQPASPGQFPHQASNRLTLGSQSAFCGASLICDSWVLTAGHCASGVSSFTIGLGSVNQSQPTEEGRVVITTTRGIVHENYDPNTLNNDIALVDLGQKVALTGNIQPIRLARNRTADNVTVTVSGWGKTSEVGSVSPVLNYVNVTTISNAKCAEVYGTRTVINSTICAQGKPQHSTCNGDSGGPLIQRAQDGVVEQIGVVSFVHIAGCGSGNPSGYVRVASLRSWIESKIGNSCTLL